MKNGPALLLPLLKCFRSYVVGTLIVISSIADSYSQTTNFSISQIAYSDADFSYTPFRGAEKWNGQNTVQIPQAGVNTSRTDIYYRFSWGSFETTQGNYTFTLFDQLMHEAIDGGGKFSFGIMTVYPSGSGQPGITNIGGYACAYPSYLHTLMQALPAGQQDWSYASEKFWIPNYNSEAYLSRWEALLQAIAAHIRTTSYKGVAYKDAINYIDVRGHGSFGEWHNYPYQGSEPSSAVVLTEVSMKRLIDAHTAAFPDFYGLMLHGTYGMSSWSPFPLAAKYYALMAGNNKGKYGIRRDSWGDPAGWFQSDLENNTLTYNGVAFKTEIMNRWKTSPVGGEPSACCTNGYAELETHVQRYHLTSFGNGNMEANNATTQANYRAASKRAGFRIVLTGGNMTTSLAPGSSFNISLNWQNVGVAPSYEDWDVVYELRNSSGTVAWSGKSAFKPKLFLPASSAQTVQDVFSLGNVSQGTYSLYLVVRDQSGYRQPLPLAITGRNTDGSYLLRNNITVGAGSGNQLPTANAGPDKTITLPTNTTSLTGSGTDPDGTITSYAWTKVSGPAGGNLSSPNAAAPSVTGLQEGTYVYRLTVTDNNGAVDSDDMQITVQAAPASSGNIAVNAGKDQTLAAGTKTATLSGTASGGSPASTGGGSSSNVVDLIIIQGESNAGGKGQNALATASELAPHSQVKILNNQTLQFENLDIGYNNNLNQLIEEPTNMHGMELGLANEAEAGRLTNPVYLVKIGRSGAHISWWRKGDTQVGLWNSYIPYVDKAVALLKQMGVNYRITVWQSIGLNDRYQGTTATSFESDMKGFISEFRSRFGATIPFLSMNFYNNPALTYDWKYIWDNLEAADANFHQVSVQGATYIDGNSHFDYAGLKLIAKNMVDKMQQLGITPGNGTGNGTTLTTTWSKVSGPTGGTIQSPNALSTTVSGLQEGVYLFRLTVTDGTNTVADDLQVTVSPAGASTNEAPAANAGADKTIILPTTTTTLNGSGIDADGTIASYAWTKVSGPAGGNIASPAAANTNITALQQGTYVFRLTVTDNGGATGSDNVQVTVNAAPNQSPTVTAGPDKTITLPTNTTSLSGSGTDPDGNIVSYAWTKISGPGQFTISSPTQSRTVINNLIQGTYVFQLTVTDDQGASASDRVNVTVNPADPAANQTPVANAGTNKAITLPTNSVHLTGSGSDADGTIVSYRWNKVSGPAGEVITSPNQASTDITGLIAGTYVFRLTVTDNSGASDADDVQVIVNAAANIAPKVNAGADIEIAIPLNSVVLNGIASDPDGSIKSYQWTKISGPDLYIIESSGKASTTVSGLVAGTYVFQLRVTDNNGAVATDRVTVIVTQNFSMVSLYPNPATTELNVRIDAASNANITTIRIFDEKGIMLYQEQFMRTQQVLLRKININSLTPGIYFVQVNPDINSEQTLKFIKQ